MKMDDAPEKRVELHLHTTMSAMDALTSVGPKAGAGQKRGQAGGGLGPPGHCHHRPRRGPVLPGRLAFAPKSIKILYGVEAYYINDVDDRVVVHGETEQPFDQ